MGLVEFVRWAVDTRNLMKRIEEIKRELAEWKARAERAEKFWGERQADVADLATQLQNEKLKTSQAESNCMKKIMRLAQFAAVRMIQNWGFAVSLQLYKKGADFSLGQLSIILRPRFIVAAFCEILGITQEELLADSNLKWEGKLKQALSNDLVLRRDDNFSDLGGELGTKDCCQRGKCGTDGCQGGCKTK